MGGEGEAQSDDQLLVEAGIYVAIAGGQSVAAWVIMGLGRSEGF